MIVEDDVTSVKLLRILLEEVHGFAVSFARRGSEVQGLAEKDKPDVFLIDYHLVDTDGVELIRSLRKTEQFVKTPIVMASGMDVEKEALAAGANKFLTKPYDPGALADLFTSLTAPAKTETPAEAPAKAETPVTATAAAQPEKPESPSKE